MKRYLPPFGLLLLLAIVAPAQSGAPAPNSDDSLTLAKNSLRADLQGLEAKVVKLDEPLAQARARTEIADATWVLDQAWAKRLLRGAYELTFPPEAECARLRERPAGSRPPGPPDAAERARNEIRNRVLSVAQRDRAFAGELAQLGAEQLGKYEEQFRYSVLANQATAAGDMTTAAQFAQQSFMADPTQLNPTDAILQIAARDRSLADQLTLQYIEQLRAFQLAHGSNSLTGQFALYNLIYQALLFAGQQKVAPPGPVVMRAYVAYELESLARLGQSAPESLQRSRLTLLNLWPVLKQYAPELTGQFMELEQLSRRPGDSSALPTQESIREKYQDDYERRLKAALHDAHFEEAIIYSAISHGDFGKVRKLIAKLDDGAQKTQFTDMVNTQDALSLAAAGDRPGAQRLAEQLTRANSIQQVYPVLINKCGANKDVACASALVYQAMKQLKRADTAPATPPAGIPASAFMSSRELDPLLSSLSKLAQAVLPINESLGFEVLDEAVRAANVSEMDTKQGRTGFDAAVFKQFAAKNEAHVRQAAETFKDPLRQIVALAAIYQRQAEELTKREQVKP